VKFGLGTKTGIDLQGEDSGILHDYSSWTDIDLATASFGQGISATPLQVLNAFNVLANGGKYLRPRIVYRIVTDGKTVEIPVKQLRQVISKGTSDTITDMLIKTVDGGEAKFFNLKTYKIAGKTGTAQIPVGGKYDPSKTNATFVGYLSESRRFSMIVRLDKPVTSIYASETAVPLWMKITGDLVKYFGIAPDRSQVEETPVLDVLER
jgi:cell division protein FtsI/penicillin-binding protein 2